MKHNFRSFLLASVMIAGSQTGFAQVEIDKPIQLNGADGQRSISGLELPTSGTQAASKDYVDQQIQSVSSPSSNLVMSIGTSIGSTFTYTGQNSSATPITVTASPVSGNLNPVTLSLSGLPSGVTYTLTPGGGYPTIESKLVFAASPSATPGAYTITIQVDGASNTPTANVTLNIGAALTAFVTSTTHTGNLGGIAGANAICNARAAAAGLPLTYKAWLSSSGGYNASSVLINNGPYLRTDGTVFANNNADLLDFTLIVPLNRDEFGNVANGPVWTNTQENGTIWQSSDHCNAWTSGNGGTYGRYGESTWSDYRWTRLTWSDCNVAMRLYCFPQ